MLYNAFMSLDTYDEKAIKVIECRDVDYETAKKEVMDTSQREARRTPLRSRKILNLIMN